MNYIRAGYTERSADAKYRAVVVAKIALRPGDNTDLLEALGLTPLTHERTECACGWVTPPGSEYPAKSLANHTRKAHRKVTA